MALMGNSSCSTSLAAYHVLWPCFKAIFLFSEGDFYISHQERVAGGFPIRELVTEENR
jgi:hypothetical protein